MNKSNQEKIKPFETRIMQEKNISPLLYGGGSFILFLVSLFIIKVVRRSRRIANFPLEGKHVVITGGSSGIGKAIASQVLKEGAVVTLVARDEAKLTRASSELGGGQKIHIKSLDVGSSMETVGNAMKAVVEQASQPVEVLINCAGTSIPGTFDDLDPDTFEKMMRINYFGSVFPTRAVVPAMKSNGSGRVVFVSSQAGQVGIFGFSAYSPSKFALTGLAQVLRMELKPHGIFVSVAYPPDTNTPGFQEENKSKPEETRLISETAGLFEPEQVASNVVSGLRSGDFAIYTGLDGWMLANLTAGMAPVASLFDGVIQVLLTSLLRLIALFYIVKFDGIVSSCKRKREAENENM